MNKRKSYTLNTRQTEIKTLLLTGEWTTGMFHDKKTCAKRRNDPKELVNMGAAWEAFKYELSCAE